MHQNKESIPMSIRDLVLLPFTLLARLVTGGPREETFTVRGSRSSCHAPLSLAALIVENIDAKGIHRSDGNIRLDGGSLHDLAERGLPGLTRTQRKSLSQAGDVGLESAVFSFDGDVVLTGVPLDLARRAQERGATTGFVRADLALSIAMDAARRSGRPLSGALASL